MGSQTSMGRQEGSTEPTVVNELLAVAEMLDFVRFLEDKKGRSSRSGWRTLLHKGTACNPRARLHKTAMECWP